MIIEPRDPKLPFDFGRAVTLPFRTVDGKRFITPLLIWMTLGMTLIYILTWPMMMSEYGTLLEYNWQNMQATLSGGTPPDPAEILSLLGKMAPAYILMMFGMWIVLASGEGLPYTVKCSSGLKV